MSLSRAVLKALKHGPKSNFELAEATGDSGGAIARTCNTLLAQGNIVRIDGGSGRGSRAVYALPKHGQSARRLGGAGLYERIVARAAELDLSPQEFARPLSGGKHVATWLNDLRRSAKPKPYTINRVEALLAGQPIPDSPEIIKRRATIAARCADQSYLHVAGRKERIENPPPPVDRDPCFKCGVRADVGCRHRQAAWC